MMRITGGRRPQNLRYTLHCLGRYLGRHRLLLGLVLPILYEFSGSHPQATVAAVGKAVAGGLPVTPLSPPSSCTLSPCGPSDMRKDDIPEPGTGFVNIKSLPATSAAFSSVVSRVKSCFISIFYLPLSFLVRLYYFFFNKYCTIVTFLL